mmetsp:Transcript_26000/g.53380  ORF Transcript_26000/g.53380 Transcript_26000/m.53380 type:complete len:346 (-) Transcript_26000:9-1046(-)
MITSNANDMAKKIAPVPHTEHHASSSEKPPLLHSSTKLISSSSTEANRSKSSSDSLSSLRKATTTLEEKYLVKPYILGCGRQGSVRECVNRHTGRRLAVKSIRKSDPAVHPRNLIREATLLAEVKHPHIIPFVEVCEDDENFHIITEICEGGDLFDRTSSEASNGDEGCFSELQAARILYEILHAVRYLHQHNVLHRDIKPENILFQTLDENSPIKLIDFGLARKHFPHKGEPPLTSVSGTPYYIAPEVLRKSYDKACDVWSVGVIAHILLCGQPPFNGANGKVICRSVVIDPVRFSSKVWKDISVSAKDFVARLLRKDPKKRLTAEQALRHPWILNQIKLGRHK